MFQDEEDVVRGDEGAEAGGGCFGEKAPGASVVRTALADFLTDFLIALHFPFASCAASCMSCFICWPR